MLGVPLVIVSNEMYNILQGIYSSPTGYVSMCEDEFTDLCAFLFYRFNDASSYLVALTGTADNLIRALSVDLNSMPIQELLSLYRQLGVVIIGMDNLVDHLSFILDMVQDTCNNYDGEFYVEFIDSFRSINDKLNAYSSYVRSVITIYRNIENGLLIRGLINDLKPDFYCESV